MPLDRKRKLAFCHIPRTGGVSICESLNLEIIEKHEPASWYRKNFPNYFLFATFRSYEDRIRSAFGWKNPINRPYSLDETVRLCVEEAKIGKISGGMMIWPNEYFLDCEVDFLLDFNNLQDSLNKMFLQLGYKKIELKHINSFR